MMALWEKKIRSDPPPAEAGHFHPIYRPDIDGLRAFAVLAVVAFHAFPGRLRGGFIGVDVFFVISGFLISSIIFRGLASNTFSFVNFYGRRIRRIFPALGAVLAASGIFGWITLLPEEYAALGKHIAAASAFVENFVLWQEVGYFDQASELKPLLHLWSLAIEEQFYLAYPFIVWAAWRTRIGLLAVLLLFGVISFGFNIADVKTDPVGDFFLPQTRFWELFSGAGLAYYAVFRFEPPYKNLWIGDLASIAGALLLLTSITRLNSDRAFPGWIAILPVLGTILIIFAGSHAWLNRQILSHPLMVFVGTISYPLYLWHWPLLSFARIIFGEGLPAGVRIFLVAISFLLAWLTYYAIERPLRFGRYALLKVAALSAAGAVIAVAGLAVYMDNGSAFRPISREAASLDATHEKFFKYLKDNFYECGPDNIRELAVIVFGSIKRCAQSSVSSTRTMAIIGDSHGEHLFIGLAEALKSDQNLVYYQYPCQPFYGRKETQCDDYVRIPTKSPGHNGMMPPGIPE